MQLISDSIRELIEKDRNNDYKVIGKGSAWGYQGEGYFFRSKDDYVGTLRTCNGKIIEILSKNIKNIDDFNPSLVKGIFRGLYYHSKYPNTCVKWYSHLSWPEVDKSLELNLKRYLPAPLRNFFP